MKPTLHSAAAMSLLPLGSFTASLAVAQDSTRKELRREDLSGSPIMNLRDVKHGGFKVTGRKTIKLLTVHIVDKGKPLYDNSKN